MARYKKRPGFDQPLPGLFDNLEGNSLFPEIEPLPIHPSISEAARREASKALHGGTAKQRRELFANDDFTPLEVGTPQMKLTFMSFGSGSSGNCAFVSDGETGILIDAGVDSDSVICQLGLYGIKMESVRGVLLTHDHSDHVRYVYKIVRKRFQTGVYCTPRTLNGLLRRHNISNRLKDYHRPIYKEHPFKIGGFTITAFDVSHDGTDNCGFFIQRGDRNIVIATDMGMISERADFYIRQANHLMIEADYDDAMLEAGSYPEYLKARIRGAMGHLSNTVTANYLREIYHPGLRNVFLCHLSKDNNTPRLATATVEAALTAAGATVGDASNTPYARMCSLQLLALPRYDATPLIPLL